VEKRLSVQINPKPLQGPWDGGYALDLHTLSSTPIGYDSYGHMTFDTTYSAVGGLLYRLKSKADPSVVPSLVEAIETFWALSPRPRIDLIVPVPPTRRRKYPPVLLVAAALSERMNVPLCTDCISKVKATPQLKDLVEYDKRMAALNGAFTVDPARTARKDVLLFDDLYRSGATASAITTLLKREGKAKAVRLLTLTRTRSKS
jgi:predicted amidophosphoribosyltransferase